MLLTANVTKLKCIIFGAAVQMIETGNYGIKCNQSLIQETLDRGQFLLDLYNLSTTVCKQLECDILSFNENKTSYCLECNDPCERVMETENV